MVDTASMHSCRATKQVLGRVAYGHEHERAGERRTRFRAEVRDWLRDRAEPASSPACAAPAAPGASTRPSTSGWPGTSTSPPAGWTCLGWPVEHGGRGASDRRAGDLPRGVRPRQRAARRQPPRRGAARPDADRVRHARAAGAVPAQDQGAGRAVVPGLLRARRRLRPGRRQHRGPARRRRMVDHRAEGLDVAGPRRRLVLRRWPAPSRARRATTACPTCSCR